MPNATYRGYGSIPNMGLMCSYDAFNNKSWMDTIAFDMDHIGANTYLFHKSWAASDAKGNVFISFWVPDYDLDSGTFTQEQDIAEADQYAGGYRFSNIENKHGTFDVVSSTDPPGEHDMLQNITVW